MVLKLESQDTGMKKKGKKAISHIIDDGVGDKAEL